MARCEICNKSISYGNKLSIARSHISRRTSRTFKPNVQSVKVNDNGTPRKMNVCTRCLRSGKVERI